MRYYQRMELAAFSSDASAEAACQRGDYESAASQVLQAYGSELYTFLLARLGDPGLVDDAFSEFAEDFWYKLRRFDWHHPLRAYCYQLARHAAERALGGPDTRREAAQSAAASFESNNARALARQVQLQTKPQLISEVTDEFQKLREKLSASERDLLILRVDRDLSWRELAVALLADGEPSDEPHLRQKELILRERFAALRDRLEALAIEAGLL